MMTAGGSAGEVLYKCLLNLYGLSSRQAEYIKQDDWESLLEILQQKQIIIDFIAGLDLTSLQLDEGEKEKFRDIAGKTGQLDSECRALLELKESLLSEKIHLMKLKEYCTGQTDLQKAILDKEV